MSPSSVLPPTPEDPAPTRLVDWFTRPGERRAGVLNLSFNALDRHVVRGLADQAALLHPEAAAGTRSFYSYAVLLERVGLMGGGLRELGVRPGQVVLVLLPVEPDLVVALLACARMGAVAVPVAAEAFDADPDVAARDLPQAPAVVLVDGPYKRALDGVLERAGRRPAYTVVRDPVAGTLDESGDLDLALLMRPGQFEPGACVELPVDAPFLALPSASGSVVHDQGWTVNLAADAHSRGLGPGSYVVPATYGGPDSPYAALLGPLLVGATVELR